MITNLDRQNIDYVISNAISVICFYGLEIGPKQRNAIRQHLLKIINSRSADVHNEIPDDFPDAIKLAFKDITAYFYSRDPKRDFFLLGNLVPTLAEIQTYMGNMLRSVSFYLDDNPDTKPTHTFPEIDIAVKQILHPANKNAKKIKKNITFQQALDHANKALNDEQNITVYKQIKKPVTTLLNTKNNLKDEANNPQRIALDQRLLILELLNDTQAVAYVSTKPGTRSNHAHRNNHQNNLIERPIESTARWPAMFMAFGIIGFIATRYLYPTMPLPLWPAGMSDLSNSNAQLAAMGAQTQIDSVDNIVFPLVQYFNQNYPVLTLMSFDIHLARNFAKHENLTYGITKMRQHTYGKLIDNGRHFINIYAGLWAFFAEHGRNVTNQAAFGITIPLTSEQAHDLRALEALRAGLEALLKEQYPEYHSRFSCNNYQNPLEQIGALNDLTKLESESQHNMYNERVTLFYDWLYMMKKYNIHYEDYQREVMNFYIPKEKSINLSESVLNAMHNVMDNKNCPWWQAPLGYISKTVGTIQNTVCEAWKNTMPNLQINKQHRHYDHNEFKTSSKTSYSSK